jgi:hypothetical protein
MLLFTATAETMGQMPGDFCDAVEGELVVTFSDCHVPAHEDDLFRCREGCPARFFGLNSHERTSAAQVRDVPISREDYLVALSAYAEHRGSRAPDAFACYKGTQMVSGAVTFLPGTVVGFKAGKLTVRREPPLGLRGAALTASCVVRAFAWRRHYDKTINEIDRAHGQP